MANVMLVEMLTSEGGVEKFNTWRREHPTAEVDLSGANLARTDLSRADLAFANLRGAKLAFANIIRADLRHANLTGVRLGKTRGVGYALFSGAHMDNRTAHRILIELEKTFVGLVGLSDPPY